MSPPFDWIFFDCFNTLIDDFDPHGDESGLGPMQHLPVKAGLYADVYELRRDYLSWRQQTVKAQPEEMPIQDRLRALLERRSPPLSTAALDQLVTQMVDCFIQTYPATLRLPAGVQEMLGHWRGTVSMGVVSNFHVGALPEQLLESFGLRQYFDFVVDSAQCGYRKPSDQIYAIAAATAQVPPEEYHRILFIGDHLQNDCLKPRTLGMSAVYFDRSAVRPRSASAPENIPAIQHWDDFRQETLPQILGLSSSPP
ncbi:HAD family hydrolase [Lyngbya confervoides]|uniref:HAD family hydrolase n=1 Tax=Lyngbya confervoides BDU141951 TaxID=1574623 RepID=A0ABD4T0F8_9CYAN|nr:HAD family hydrolase [Lyngbya confervoides]MCM1982251.1 HAD family hydrolase [Lyngbya confervoides BDU141951]